MLALLSKLRRQALLFPRLALQCFEVQVRSVLPYGAVRPVGCCRLLPVLGWEPIEYRRNEPVHARYERLASTVLPVEELLARFATRFDDEWEKVAEDVDPRAYHAVRPSVAVCKHKCWMGEAAHLKEYIPSSHLAAALIRFRVCAQELEVSRARGRPRAERVCRMCMAGAVEDERHFLLECEAYADLRAQHGFDADDMREAMAGDQRRLAKHLHAASRARRERLAVR